MSIRAHKQAILDRLRADPILTDATFEGVVTDRPSRYVAVFIDSGYRYSERLTGAQATADYGVTAHSVGTTPDQAQFVAERVFAQLLGHVLQVPGFRCRRVRHEASQPTQIDRDIDPPLFYAVDVFEFTSEPA